MASEEVTATPDLNRILGFDPSAKPSIGDIRALYLPGERERMQDAARRATDEGKTQFESEFRCRRPDGNVRWLMLRAEILPASDGQPERIIGVLMDIDDRKRWEERQALLMRELNHRVKNSLSVIQALAKQSFRGRADPGALEDFLGRLRALATANDVLLENQLREFDLESLLIRVTEPYAGAAPRFTLAGGKVTLPPRLNVPLALVLHELATNAAKFGALSGEDGRVEMKWTPHASGTELSWVETGGPGIQGSPEKGFGMRLVEDILSAEIGGVSVDFLPAGLRCQIQIRHEAR
ncbi:MAG: signal transduction histidine kinase [Microvirga sp.]|nr:signal transduction histidine kinase [Microvirga sp.]